MIVLVYLFSAVAFELLWPICCHLQNQRIHDGRHYSAYDDFRGIQRTIIKREINSTGTDKDDSVCTTGACEDAAANILFRMNPEADPCEDFYNFACGGIYINNKRSIELQNLESALRYLRDNEHNSDDKYLQVYTMFYNSCVEYRYDFEMVEHSRAFIAQQATTNLTDIFVHLTLSQSMPVFDVGLDIDQDQNYILQLTVPGSSSLKTGLKFWTVMERLNEECSKKIWNNVNTETITEINNSIKSCSAAQLRKHIDAYIEFLKYINGGKHPANNFAEMKYLLITIQEYLPTFNEIKIAALTRTHETFDIEQLMKQWDLIDWRAFLQAVTTHNVIFNGNEKVHVYFPNYFHKVFKFLRTYEAKQISKILNQYFDFQLYFHTILPPKEGNHELYCFNLANELMPDVATIIAYNSTYLNMDLFMLNVRIHRFFKDFKQILDEYFDNSTLDVSSKIMFKDALKNITLGLIRIGDSNISSESYNNVILSGDYQKNLLLLISHMRKRVFSFAGTKSLPASLLHYFLEPYSNRPKSFYGLSTILLHPGIFLDTVIDPDYIGLSKNGMEIARELIRNFDLTNAHRFKTASKSYKKMNSQTTNLFEEITKDSLISLEQLNTTLLLNEIIVDNAAFEIIFQQFMSMRNLKNLPWISQLYSKTQIFLLSFVQEYCQHSPEDDNMRDLLERGKLPIVMKIRNILGNSEQFREAFQCPDGSAMLIDSSLRSQFLNIEYDDDYYDTK